MAKLESDSSDIGSKLERIESEREQFMKDYEQYQLSHVDEQEISDQQRVVEDQCYASALAEKEREEDYLTALTFFNNAQDRKKELSEQIDQIEMEIKQDINTLLMQRQNFENTPSPDNSVPNETQNPTPPTHAQLAKAGKQTLDDEINDALAFLDNNNN